MGATVLGCGHASQLFKVEYLNGTPQVHLHFLTDDDEYQHTGFGKVEIVCHGCGDSLLIAFDESHSRRKYLAQKNMFQKKHRGCPNRGFEKSCPDYRRSVAMLDMRRPPQISP